MQRPQQVPNAIQERAGTISVARSSPGCLLLVAIIMVLLGSVGTAPAAARNGQAPGTAGWTVRSVNIPTYNLTGIACPSARRCVAVGGTPGNDYYGIIVVSNDGGATWSRRTPAGTASLLAVACPSTTRCLATVSDGTFLVTNDGGAQWSRRDLANVGSIFYPWGISCPSINRCVTTAYNASIYRTDDGGTTWSNINTPLVGTNGYKLEGIACPTSTHCLAVGTSDGNISAIVASSDGGATWHTRPAGDITVELTGITCATPTHCLAVGTADVAGTNGSVNLVGAVQATTDGGTTWHAEILHAAYSLQAIACPSAGRCLAVGEGGTMVVSSNGGATWRTERAGTKNNLNGIACPSAGRCLAVGDHGTLLVGRL